MAETQVNQNNVVTRFLSDFFAEYVRQNRFSRYTGTGSTNPIVIKEGRQKISIPLVSRLNNDAVTGAATLDGNEEDLGNYAWELTPTYYRNGVRFSKEEKEKPNIDLMRGAREQLMNWAMHLTKQHVIQALGAIYDGTTYNDYGDASESQKDTWLSNNTGSGAGGDRVLFGNSTSNLSAGDHSASLANVDTTNDTLDTDILGLLKRLAQNADPHIRPVRTREDEEFFVVFTGSRAFRDLRNDSTMENANRDARIRGENNPLFMGGDLMWDNMIIREVPEITQILTDADNNPNYKDTGLSTAGNSNSAVEPVFLCGAQAIGFGLGQRPDMIVDRDKDYQFRPGVAVELKHEIRKMFFNNFQHGMITGYVAGAAD